MLPDFIGATVGTFVLVLFATLVILHAIDAVGRPHTGRPHAG